MLPSFSVSPVAFVWSDRVETRDDGWGDAAARIELVDSFDAEALIGLDAFSHALILYVLDRVDPETAVRGSRHPRNDENYPRVGIFAQRAKRRPNRLGATVCEITSVDGTTVHVRGLDAVAGTPVLDIKPYLTAYAPRTPVREPAWTHEVMRGYW